MNLMDLKLAFRNIQKNKTESGISILGLGIGLGCIMILGVLFIHEHSFDKFIPKHQSAYRLLDETDPRLPYPMAPALKNNIPEIADFFRFYQTSNVKIKTVDNRIIAEDFFAFADANMYSRMGIGFRYGVPAVSNAEIALSEDMAEKYFGSRNALGSTLLLKLQDEFRTLTVCGVYNNFPGNSTLRPEFVGNIDLSEEVFGLSQRMFGDYRSNQDDYRNWDNRSFYVYLFLQPNADPEVLGAKIKGHMVSLDTEKYKDKTYRLQPVADIYLESAGLSGNLYSRAGNANELKYYMAIAFAILLIAITNYVFLTKAKILNRLTEMGAKKALGASNATIQKQVLLESNLVSFLSLLPAAIVVIVGIPFVNSTLGKTVGSEVFSLWQTWAVLAVLLFLTGTISGISIGSSVSRTSVVVLLKGKLNRSPGKYSLSHSFLSFHFAIFIILIVSVFTFKKQINYGLTNFKAIDPTNILICELNTPELQKQIRMLQNELDKNPNVVKTAGSSFIPPFDSFLPVNLRTEDESVRFDGLIMGQGMIDLLGMEWIDGECFGEFQADNRTNIIINESAALQYKLKAGDLLNGFTIRGIVKDFSAHSIHSLIQPMVILQQHPEKMSLLAIKTNGLHDAEIIGETEHLIRHISPESLVSIRYLTDQINQFYTGEQNQAKLITGFSFLAIVLAVMGLFGIVLITISKRTKEIGIRKVNGARATEVIEMLNRDFLKWVFVALVLATPVAWYAMHLWLENFAYKTELSWWIFVLAGLLALGIALLTVSWQSWRTATRNPVEALRYE
ncbi:ABC transporter permease [Maribellus luteus]|uniref:ABC transporter permease n=1 Tax=Maribellus luteus TaxID=2305463 RepID=A0A399T0P0_9BACT|nr:ABC transporter permease [Maribellus luteus]RIJ48235.1 ABC transporter permease [Maribellus luteus]